MMGRRAFASKRMLRVSRTVSDKAECALLLRVSVGAIGGVDKRLIYRLPTRATKRAALPGVNLLAQFVPWFTHVWEDAATGQTTQSSSGLSASLNPYRRKNRQVAPGFKTDYEHNDACTAPCP